MHPDDPSGQGDLLLCLPSPFSALQRSGTGGDERFLLFSRYLCLGVFVLSRSVRLYTSSGELHRSNILCIHYYIV